ncbi:MAG: hypothetical protein E6K80_09095 [Candidatus Eisenbacteria bacterium]|uniref:Fibronectin type-III domain-containing protein n=1 Tax=Eiseniibacteriota bacterium TaxID=2212470 RepID=A0A538U2W6_UNCEI|nr:MAG: hypothetical protein E6K80_09095 [Candidatus Eisenbacteria bacterium]
MRRTLRHVLMLAGLLHAAQASAVETQMWVSDSPADYAKADARGVVVGPDGVVALGPRTAQSPAESLTVVWSLAVMADGSVALGGDSGRIDRWTENGGVRPWIKLPAGQVLSLAPDGAGLVAGTGPQGRVYRIGARGDTTLLAKTGERYVWALAPASGGAWWAATGTRGRLMKISPGKATIVLDTDESNLVSLVADGRGGCYAGGDSKGRVVHVTADGAATTTYDAAEDEVRALALGPDGALYAAGLTAAATTNEGEEDESQRPQPVKSAVTGGRATVYRIVPDSSAAALWTAPHPFVFALLGTSDGVLAATGNRAGLFRLDRTGFVTQILSAPQGQITALARDRGGRVFAATSNPGALWRLGPERTEHGELTSSSLDARRFARFGHVRWRGQANGGRIQLETRSGNTDPADTTWSSWRPITDQGVRSPAARYLQWKITMAGGNPRVDAVEVGWREQNIPPRVEDVAVAPQGMGFREGELQPRTEPVTQTLPGGQRVEYSISNPSGHTLKILPEWTRGLRTLQWHASDPNGDPLLYQVDMRAESGGAWTSIGKDLEATSFTWDTRNVPDGRYRIRVRASDAPGNAVGEALQSEAVSEPFTVDNTPPQVTSLGLRGEPRAIAMTGRAEDALSILVRVDVAVDEDDWREVTPQGGMADERALEFHARLPDIEPGEHTVAVRVVDQAGNGATRAGRVTVPRAR